MINDSHGNFYNTVQKQIINYWTRLSKNCSRENFINELDKWKNIQKCIDSRISCLGGLSNSVIQKTCKTCRIIWKDKKYIKHNFVYTEEQPFYNSLGIKINHDMVDIIDICPNCDMYINPFLSNPINELYVKKYILSKFHKYILPTEHSFYIKGLRDGKQYGINDGINDTLNDIINVKLENIDTQSLKRWNNIIDFNNHSYLDGFIENYDVYYKKTYHINDMFINELKQKINEKNSLQDSLQDSFEKLQNLNEILQVFQEDDDEENIDENEWLLV